MLHEVLRLVRTYHDMSQTTLCVELGIPNSYLLEIESGRKQPTLDLLNRYNEYFGIPVCSLIFFSEKRRDSITNGVRLVIAKKMISLLQWVEGKNAKKVVIS